MNWNDDMSAAPRDGTPITLLQDGVEFIDHEWFEGSWCMVFCDQAGPYVAQRLTHPTHWAPSPTQGDRNGGGE